MNDLSISLLTICGLDEIEQHGSRGVTHVLSIFDPDWPEPIILGRHAFGDQYRATDFRFPGKGKLTIKFVGEDGQTIEHEVFDAPGSGVAMAMYNLDDSIRDFARASLNYGLRRGWPVYLSTKNTILKAHYGGYKDIFQDIDEKEFQQWLSITGFLDKIDESLQTAMA